MIPNYNTCIIGIPEERGSRRNVYRNDSQEYTAVNDRHQHVDPRSSKKVGRGEEVEHTGCLGQ